ncbi:helix-turn-helix domain-containing protein [Nocardia sp. AG03]|uniref:helix-turn-helix domain-containing protein n=1 Tax=Nocardia sp. AG03 TaxID=3025312 RepID=UPI002418B9AA|nr:helix-turn-helix domain-containing protein [Nocardia sp. AG03]
MSTQQKRMYAVPVAAELLGISRATLYVLIRDGAVRSVKVGGRRLISSDAIAEFVERADQGAA